MHSKFHSWLSILGLFFAFAFSAHAQGTQIVGEIRATRVVGQVTVEDIASKAVLAVVNNAKLTQGSIVRTAQNSSVVLLFANGASVSLAANSELNIEQFTHDPFGGSYEPAKATDEPSVSTTNLKLARGELVGNVKKLKTSAGSKFTVGTPVGAAGIRGTTFRIVYRPTGIGLAYNFSILTVEGNVEVLLSTGTVNAPPVSVTDNKEIVINNVTVNPATNEVVVMSQAGQTVVLATLPPATDASVTAIQQVQANAQQIAQAGLNVTFAGDPNLPASGANTAPPGDTPGTPGGTTPNQRITPGAGL
ncbi:MAG: FecR family protein [Opitutaceae bacterium]